MFHGDDLTTSPAPRSGVALSRVAAGLVDECRQVGRSTRTVASPVDALVVHALVAARSRQEAVPLVVSRVGERLVAELVSGDTTPPASGVSTWGITADTWRCY